MISTTSLELCTAVLGLFLALPLIALARRRTANAWLGMFVLSLSLLSLSDYLRSAGAYARFPQLWGLCDWPLATIGTFYYLYVRAMTGLGNGRRQFWHALPLAVWLVLVAQVRMSGSPWLPVGLFLLLFQLVAVGYAVAVLYRLHGYRRRLRENYSSTKNRDLAWLMWLTLVIMALLVLWLPVAIADGPWKWALIAGRLAVLYFVGWYGMRQAVVFLPRAPAQGVPVLAPGPAAEPASAPAEAAAGADKYARSGMTDAAQQLIGERLARRAANEDDHLDSDTSLTDLAERIGTSPQLLSQYLNDVLGVNFFDYINGLRVLHVQNMMRTPASAGQPLLDLAFGAGFNSRSTFNAAFKKMSGMAPSAWRKLHVPMSEPIGQD
jgi:AraC-like DNA-binding protein